MTNVGRAPTDPNGVTTNRPLHEALEGRKLREDLYYRLNVFRIAIPPLRERLEDLDFARGPLR
jgi:transcriptional regulator with PAS, ATPase and Fis domain